MKSLLRRNLKGISTALCVLFAVNAHAAESLCQENEVVMFSCRIGSKIVSLCSSRDVSATSGYIQYRFGRPGRKPELTYPQAGVKPTDAFSYYYDGYAKGSTHQLTFTNGLYSYTLYSERHVFEWSGSGVVVEEIDKQVANLRCDDRTIQSGFHKIETIGLPARERRELGVERP
jgi:hypothetical protein